MRTTHTVRLLLLSGVATAALLGPAMALDAQAFVDRVAAVYHHVGYDLSFGPATLNGDTITVDGVTVDIASPDADVETMTFDAQLTFAGVTEAADGSYTVKSLTIPDIDTEFSSAPEPVGHLSLRDIGAHNLYLPAGDTLPTTAMIQLIGSISTGPLSVTRDGKEVAAITSMETTTTSNPPQGTGAVTDVHTTMAINGIVVDLASVGEDDPDTAAVIEALGLTSLRGNITQDATWSLADGHMVVNEFLFDFTDLGALNITADLTGITPVLLDQLAAMQAAGEDLSEEQAQAQMMSGMAMLQGVSIVGASVRYDDASLAGKLLDYYAKESGSDRATFVEGLKSMLPVMLAETGIPALKDIVVPPVSAFLDNPQSLEVKVAPPSPTSLLVLMAAAANPAGLITALGFTLQANTAK